METLKLISIAFHSFIIVLLMQAMDKPDLHEREMAIPTLSCLAIRCLVKETDYLNKIVMHQIPANTIPCVKEVLSKELIKPYLFPLLIRSSKNEQSVHHNGVCDFDYIPEHNQLVSMACDGKLVFYNGSDVAVGDSYSLEVSMSALRVSQDSPMQLFLGGLNGHLYTMNYDTKRIVADIAAHEADLAHLAVNTDYIVSSSNDKTVKVWNRPNNGLSCVFNHYKSAVRAVELLDTQNIVSGSSEGMIHLLNILDNKVEKQHSYSNETEVRIWALDLARKSGRIMAGFNSGKISLFDINGWREIAQWPGHEGLINSLAVDKDEKNFVTGSWDGFVKVWDVRMRACAAILNGHTDWVQRVFSLDNGNEIISGSRDHTICVWDLRMIKKLDQSNLDNLIQFAQTIGEKPIEESKKITTLNSFLQP